MADGAGGRAIRYSAFISYNHADVAFASKLQRRLESYRLPRRARPYANVRDDDARRLKPVFRDRDELVAASDLTHAVQEALAVANALIVVCTPASARSAWVGREIALFRELGGHDRTYAALAAGVPDDAFHAELMAGATADHAPLASDFRRRGDGQRRALLKIVAVLAGAGLDDLIQRDAHRRARRGVAVVAAAVLAATVAGVLIWTMLQARAAEDRQRARSLSSVDYALTELRERAKGAGSLGMRDAANDVASRYLAANARLSDDELEASAKLLLARGEDNEARGEYAVAQRQYEQALAITGKLVAARPRDTARIFAHAQSLYGVGFISWRLGASDRAEAAFKDYAAAADRLLALQPGKPDWLLERAYALDNLGMLTLRRTKDTTRAAAYFRDELASYRAVQPRRPGDPAVPKAIADTYGWLGDIARLRGDFAGAAAARGTQRTILDAMHTHDPRNAEIGSALVANQLAVARIAADSGALADAVARFDAGHAAALKLADADPDNKSLARKVRIFDLFKARAWLSMPAPARPDAATIAATIGDCAAERARPKNAELADFCTVLTARLLAQTGDAGAAKVLLSLLSLQASRRHDFLSERWGIDFANEIRLVMHD